MHNPDNFVVVLTDKTGKEYKIEGFAESDDITIERQWYTILDKPFTVRCFDGKGMYSNVEFTEEGFDKWIKPLKPTKQSPFSFS